MNIKNELNTMFNYKSITLILLLAFVAAGCGTDGLDVKEQPISFSDTPDNLPEAFQGQQYSYTIQIENGAAGNVDLTSFSDSGSWLDAQLVNNGSAVELTGTPSSENAWDFHNFYLASTDEDGSTATAYFGVWVNGN